MTGVQTCALPISDSAFLSNAEQAEIAAPEAEQDVGLVESPGSSYLGLGARMRWIMIPGWLVEALGPELKSRSESTLPLISSWGVGPELTYRRDGFDVTVAFVYATLGWDGDISVKKEGGEGDSWEVVNNDLSTVLLSADFIWSREVVEWMQLTFGLGIGVGWPLGDIRRTEATQASNGFEPCDGPSEDPWCGEREDYNAVYDVPTKIVPWIEILGGFRIKAHRHLVFYPEAGIGLPALFQLGLRGEYLF